MYLNNQPRYSSFYIYTFMPFVALDQMNLHKKDKPPILNSNPEMNVSIFTHLCLL